MNALTVARLWAKIDQGAPEECWPFTAARNRRGYGLLNVGGRSRLAHRLVSESVEGPLAEGVCVLHTCDNPPCCNPAHLFRGTRADNNLDMRSKGRASAPPRIRRLGERNGQAKLTDRDAVAIKQRHAAGERVTALAREFAVSHSLISLIARGKRRSH